MSMSVTRKLVIGAAAGAIALLGALAPASAKGGHHHHFYRFSQPAFVAPVYTGCDYYYSRWKNSGSRFWRAKYFACIA